MVTKRTVPWPVLAFGVGVRRGVTRQLLVATPAGLEERLVELGEHRGGLERAVPRCVCRESDVRLVLQEGVIPAAKV